MSYSQMRLRILICDIIVLMEIDTEIEQIESTTTVSLDCKLGKKNTIFSTNLGNSRCTKLPTGRLIKFTLQQFN